MQTREFMRSTMILMFFLLAALLVALSYWWLMPADEARIETSSVSTAPTHETTSEHPRRVPVLETFVQTASESHRNSPQGGALIILHAVDENGAGIKDLSWVGEITAWTVKGPEYIRTSGVTDHEGQLQLVLDARMVGLEVRWSFLLRIARSAYSHTANLNVERLRAGLNDLGEQVFRREPLVLAGRVIDSDGRAVSNAVVAIKAIPREPISNSMNPASRVLTDDEGRFVFFDRFHTEVLFEVECYTKNLMSKPLRVKRGDRSVLIQTFPLARLRARFVASGRGRLEALSLALSQSDGLWSYYPEIPADGQIDLLVSPGVYRLEVSIGQGFLHSFLQRSALRLESGFLLDLGDLLLDYDYRSVEVRLDFAGAAPPEIVEIEQVVLDWGGTRSLHRGAIDPDDPRVTIDVTQLPAEVVISAKGFRTERFVLRQEKERLQVRGPLAVGVLVEGLVPTPEGIDLQVQLLEPPDVSLEGVVAASRLDPATGVVMLGAPHSGRFLVCVSAWRRSASVDDNREFLFSSARQMIEVLDSDAKQSFVLSVKPTFLTRLRRAEKGGGKRR